MQFRRKKYIRYYLVALQLMLCSLVFAVNDPTVTHPLLGSLGQVIVNDTSKVSDYPFPGLAIDRTFYIKNLVDVGIEEDSKFMIPSDFTATVTLRIIRYDSSGALIDSVDRPFTIDYKKAEGVKHNSLQYYPFENAYEVDVRIMDIESNVSWDVSQALRVDNMLTTTRDYVFDCSAPTPLLKVVLDDQNNELTASWGFPKTGETEYDLEWAWIDDSALPDFMDQSGAYLTDKIFENNATRVTISSNSYNIPLLYDGVGHIFVRVRPAQVKFSGQRVEGNWTWQNGDYDTNSGSWVFNSTAPIFYDFIGHENLLNWQASTSYAEDGKRKSVIQYYDGSLRSRQTVTKDNTTNTTVVVESLYDYQGRPVIQLLPAQQLAISSSTQETLTRLIKH